MRPEPRVNARHVERVAALGQQPEGFVVLELPEAHGTFGAVYDSFVFPVFEDGDGVYQRLLETGGADVPHVVDRRQVVILVRRHVIVVVRSGRISVQIEQYGRVSCSIGSAVISPGIKVPYECGDGEEKHEHANYACCQNQR